MPSLVTKIRMFHIILCETLLHYPPPPPPCPTPQPHPPLHKMGHVGWLTDGIFSCVRMPGDDSVTPSSSCMLFASRGMAIVTAIKCHHHDDPICMNSYAHVVCPSSQGIGRTGVGIRGILCQGMGAPEAQCARSATIWASGRSRKPYFVVLWAVCLFGLFGSRF